MKTIKWTGKKGNVIELRASCEITTEPKKIDLDGNVFQSGTETRTEANLELWVDGTKVDSCLNINFWEIIDIPEHPGYKKIWGLNIMMNAEQAEKVEAFLKEVIEGGKNEEAKELEEAEAERQAAEHVKIAKSIIKAAEHTPKNTDGSLMSNEQARKWKKNYNDFHNEGGEGYIPNVITQEQYNRAESIIANV